MKLNSKIPRRIDWFALLPALVMLFFIANAVGLVVLVALVAYWVWI